MAKAKTTAAKPAVKKAVPAKKAAPAKKASGSKPAAPAKKKISITPEQKQLLLQAALAFVVKIGLPKLIEMFKNAGLDKQLASWISPEMKNKAITGAQMLQVLGPSAVEQIAGKAGVDPTVATGALATILPAVIDTLTPQGDAGAGAFKAAAGGLDLGTVGGVLGSFLKG